MKCLKGAINWVVINIPNHFKVFVKTDKRPIIDTFEPLVLREQQAVHVVEVEDFEDSFEARAIEKLANERHG